MLLVEQKDWGGCVPSGSLKVILHTTPPALAPTAQTPLPNPRAETPPNEDSDPGLKRVEPFLESTCKPSIHLLDHLQLPIGFPSGI